MRGAGFHRLKIETFGFFPPFAANTTWGARLESALERVPLWRPLLPFQLIGGEKPEGAAAVSKSAS
jgi:hypothetical protein